MHVWFRLELALKRKYTQDFHATLFPTFSCTVRCEKILFNADLRGAFTSAASTQAKESTLENSREEARGVFRCQHSKAFVCKP